VIDTEPEEENPELEFGVSGLTDPAGFALNKKNTPEQGLWRIVMSKEVGPVDFATSR